MRFGRENEERKKKREDERKMVKIRNEKWRERKDGGGCIFFLWLLRFL